MSKWREEDEDELKVGSTIERELNIIILFLGGN
jgi:hypothetical protein